MLSSCAVSRDLTKGLGQLVVRCRRGVLAGVYPRVDQAVRVHCFEGEWTFRPGWLRLLPVPYSEARFVLTRQRRRPLHRNTLRLNLSSTFAASLSRKGTEPLRPRASCGH